ncbi:hypothetical protein CR205_13310 [Alteribacter lacisalsi]|uniref:HTH gntR-type domain-containing protein n=1 Tax=Alteribacter lacisalsi TaxID=2045244 RepID=A0A2W0HI74_9BACI|nr:GntR family transcriptional regulator [Alteribacter lacisalsi]PYZ96672.1 hypothetical protein CR205_13310 [Alteribacter lacisalsi]
MSALSVSQPLYQQAYETIKKSILSGQLGPGSKLVTTRLAEQYQISRTPLREALRQLQVEGLLVLKQSHLEVVTLDKNDFAELSQCRLVLEREIISYIVEGIKDEQISEVEAVIEEAEKACEEQEALRLLELNSQFHRMLYEVCSNKRLVQLLDQVRSLLLIYRANTIINQHENKEILAEHKDLLEVIKKRDYEEALASVEKHLENDMKRGESVIE